MAVALLLHPHVSFTASLVPGHSGVVLVHLIATAPGTSTRGQISSLPAGISPTLTQYAPPRKETAAVWHGREKWHWTDPNIASGQDMQTEAPDWLLWEPAAQGVHAEAPGWLLWDPAAQRVHTVAPGWLLWEPAGQGVQTEGSEAPDWLLWEPAGQGIHTEAPGWLLWEPAGQAMHSFTECCEAM